MGNAAPEAARSMERSEPQGGEETSALYSGKAAWLDAAMKLDGEGNFQKIPTTVCARKMDDALKHLETEEAGGITKEMRHNLIRQTFEKVYLNMGSEIPPEQLKNAIVIKTNKFHPVTVVFLQIITLGLFTVFRPQDDETILVLTEGGRVYLLKVERPNAFGIDLQVALMTFLRLLLVMILIVTAPSFVVMAFGYSGMDTGGFDIKGEGNFIQTELELDQKVYGKAARNSAVLMGAETVSSIQYTISGAKVARKLIMRLYFGKYPGQAALDGVGLTIGCSAGPVPTSELCDPAAAALGSGGKNSKAQKVQEAQSTNFSPLFVTILTVTLFLVTTLDACFTWFDRVCDLGAPFASVVDAVIAGEDPPSLQFCKCVAGCDMGFLKSRETYTANAPYKELMRSAEQNWTTLGKFHFQPSTILPYTSVLRKMHRFRMSTIAGPNCRTTLQSSDISGWSPTQDPAANVELANAVGHVFRGGFMKRSGDLYTGWRVNMARRGLAAEWDAGNGGCQGQDGKLSTLLHEWADVFVAKLAESMEIIPSGTVVRALCVIDDDVKQLSSAENEQASVLATRAEKYLEHTASTWKLLSREIDVVKTTVGSRHGTYTGQYLQYGVAAAIPTGDTVQSELVMVFESAMEVCNSVARSSTIHPEEVAALMMLPEFAGGFGVPSRLDFEVSEIAGPLTTAIVKVGRCLNSGDGETRDTATLMANALCTEWKVVDVLALLSQPFTIPRDLNRSAKEYIRDAVVQISHMATVREFCVEAPSGIEEGKAYCTVSKCTEWAKSIDYDADFCAGVQYYETKTVPKTKDNETDYTSEEMVTNSEVMAICLQYGHSEGTCCGGCLLSVKDIFGGGWYEVMKTILEVVGDVGALLFSFVAAKYAMTVSSASEHLEIVCQRAPTCCGCFTPDTLSDFTSSEPLALKFLEELFIEAWDNEAEDRSVQDRGVKAYALENQMPTWEEFLAEKSIVEMDFAKMLLKVNVPVKALGLADTANNKEQVVAAWSEMERMRFSDLGPSVLYGLIVLGLALLFAPTYTIEVGDHTLVGASKVIEAVAAGLLFAILHLMFRFFVEFKNSMHAVVVTDMRLFYIRQKFRLPGTSLLGVDLRVDAFRHDRDLFYGRCTNVILPWYQRCMGYKFMPGMVYMQCKKGVLKLTRQSGNAMDVFHVVSMLARKSMNISMEKLQQAGIDQHTLMLCKNSEKGLFKKKDAEDKEIKGVWDIHPQETDAGQLPNTMSFLCYKVMLSFSTESQIDPPLLTNPAHPPVNCPCVDECCACCTRCVTCESFCEVMWDR
eukprot:s3032_g7.t1